MKTLKGWRKMSHNRGYQNETTSQIVTVKKKEYTDEYVVWLMPNEAGDEGNDEGKKVSPEFANEARAQEYAIDWIQKHPNGAP